MAFGRGTCVEGVASCEEEASEGLESVGVLEGSAEGVLVEREPSVLDCAAGYRLVGCASAPPEASWCSDVSSATASRVAVSASIGDESVDEGSTDVDGLGDEGWSTAGCTEGVVAVGASDLAPLEGLVGAFASVAALSAVDAVVLGAWAVESADPMVSCVGPSAA